MWTLDVDGPAGPCLVINTISIVVRQWCGNILRGFFCGIQVWDWLSAGRWIDKGIVCGEPSNEREGRVESNRRYMSRTVRWRWSSHHRWSHGRQLVESVLTEDRPSGSGCRTELVTSCSVCWKPDVEAIVGMHSRIQIQFRRSLREIVSEIGIEGDLMVCEVERTSYRSW